MSTIPRPVIWRLGASLGAGAVLALGFPPFHLWLPMTPLGVAAFVLAIRGAGIRVGAACGLVSGLTFFLVLLHWMTVIGLDAWILLAVLEAAFFAALGAATALVSGLSWWPLWVSCLWVTQEALRDRLPFGGFPWGRLAFGDEHFLLTPYAALGGAPLVTFVTALAGALVAWIVVNARDRRLLAVVTAAAVVALPIVASSVPTPTAGRPVTVALVQGNVPRSGLNFLGQREAVLDNHVAATERLAAAVRAGRVAKPDLVIWPENSSDVDPFTDAGAFQKISAAVQDIGVPVLVGMVIAAPDGHHLLNTGYVWTPGTGPGERYVKRHPVPFGEYVPFRDVLEKHISRLQRIPQDFKAGTSPGVLTIGPATVGDVICFEIAYDNLVRDAVRGGGQAIVVQTNNATYGHTAQPQQQALMSRLRAVEHGRPVLVASTSGISEVVSADGTVTQHTAQFTQAVVMAKVDLRTGRTVADRVGSGPEGLLAMVGLGAVIVAVVRRRRGSALAETEQA